MYGLLFFLLHLLLRFALSLALFSSPSYVRRILYGIFSIVCVACCQATSKSMQSSRKYVSQISLNLNNSLIYCPIANHSSDRFLSKRRTNSPELRKHSFILRSIGYLSLQECYFCVMLREEEGIFENNTVKKPVNIRNSMVGTHCILSTRTEEVRA